MQQADESPVAAEPGFARPTANLIAGLGLGACLDTGAGIPLTVCQREQVSGCDRATRRGGFAAITSLSQDGQVFESGRWHEGDGTGWVYVERWGLGGREFHGWVDAGSRRLLQTG
jgi:hypothetical protein